MNTYAKTITLSFPTLLDQNKSYGQILEFLKDGQPVASFAITWRNSFWFRYQTGDLKVPWLYHYFPIYFGDCLREDEKLVGDLIISPNQVVWSYNNTYSSFNLRTPIEFDEVRTMQRFEESVEGTHIDEFEAQYHILQLSDVDPTKYNFELSEEGLVQFQPYTQIETDIVLPAYQAFWSLQMCLDSFVNLYEETDLFKINKFIVVDNNGTQEHRDRTKSMFDQFSERMSGIFEAVYIENPDKTKVKSRISGTVLALDECSSEFFTTLDSDFVLTTDAWTETYDVYNKLPSMIGVGQYSVPLLSPQIRCGAYKLPRINPYFFHCRRQYLVDNLAVDPDFLDDYHVELSDGSVKVHMVGLHFSKPYLKTVSEMTNDFYFCHDFEFPSMTNIEKYFKIYANRLQIANESSGIHFAQVSFEEVHSDELMAARHESHYKSILLYAEFYKSAEQRLGHMFSYFDHYNDEIRGVYLDLDGYELIGSADFTLKDNLFYIMDAGGMVGYGRLTDDDLEITMRNKKISLNRRFLPQDCSEITVEWGKVEDFLVFKIIAGDSKGYLANVFSVDYDSVTLSVDSGSWVPVTV